MDTILNERVVSGFPLSIGTSLAMESIFQPRQPVYDPERKIPQQVSLANYETIYINLATLYRNLIGAIDKTQIPRLNPQIVASTLEEEIGVINDLFSMEGGGIVKPIYFHSEYRRVRGLKVPGFRLREPTTENQVKYYDLQEKTFKLMDKHTDTNMRIRDTLDPDRHEKSLILTHQPYDLLAYKRFHTLDLLESNTGVLKPRSRWSSKFYPVSGENMINIPFTRKLLYIFGDKHLIHPMPLVLRKQVLEIAQKYRWTAATTEEKVDVDFHLGIQDPYAVKILGMLK